MEVLLLQLLALGHSLQTAANRVLVVQKLKQEENSSGSESMQMPNFRFSPVCT